MSLHLTNHRLSKLQHLRTLTVVFALGLTCVEAQSQQQQTCYFPNGNPGSKFTPCNSTTQGTPTSASACCLSQNNAYCTDAGLCMTDGVLSRGACTDKTWTASGCPGFCRDVVQNIHVNLYICDAQSDIWQCGTGSGPSDCLSNFTLPPQHLVLRDDQQPGGVDAVAYSDPKVTFVNKALATMTSTANSTNNTSSASSTSSDSRKSNSSSLVVGFSVGLPLGIFLLLSLAMNFFQHRHHQQSMQRDTSITTLIKSSQRSSSVATGLPRPRLAGLGEMPTSWAGAEVIAQPVGAQTRDRDGRETEIQFSPDRNGSGSGIASTSTGTGTSASQARSIWGSNRSRSSQGSTTWVERMHGSGSGSGSGSGRGSASGHRNGRGSGGRRIEVHELADPVIHSRSIEDVSNVF